MRAVVADAPGGPEVLVPRERPDPEPAGDQVLVRVASAGVNFADVVMRRGETNAPFPLVPGVEGAGVVEQVGADVSEVAVGDRIAWVPVKQGASIGAYAEFVVVAAAQALPVPDGVSLELAGAVALQGLTARYLATEQVPLGPGVTVLVHAAAGGTGRLVVQWCRHLGATVIGTVSSDAKAEVAVAAGAQHVIRYDRDDFVAETRRLTDGAGVDYVVDGVAGGTFVGDLRAVADRGRICVFGQAGGPPGPFSPLQLLRRSIVVAGGSMDNFLRTRAEVLAAATELWQGLAEGWLTPLVEEPHPLGGAAELHRRLAGRSTVGKLVLSPWGQE